jgi:hypothetical protein
MWFPLIKKLSHPFVGIPRHIRKTGVFEPVLDSVLCEGNFPKDVLGDVFVQM